MSVWQVCANCLIQFFTCRGAKRSEGMTIIGEGNAAQHNLTLITGPNTERSRPTATDKVPVALHSFELLISEHKRRSLERERRQPESLCSSEAGHDSGMRIELAQLQRHEGPVRSAHQAKVTVSIQLTRRRQSGGASCE